MIDYIEWVTNCTPNAQTGSCMNGFEIVNDNTMLRTFPISSNATIQTFNTNWEPVSVSLQEFINGYQSMGPYTSQTGLETSFYPLNWITVQNGIVMEITPQYTP